MYLSIDPWVLIAGFAFGLAFTALKLGRGLWLHADKGGFAIATKPDSKPRSPALKDKPR